MKHKHSAQEKPKAEKPQQPSEGKKKQSKNTQPAKSEKKMLFPTT